MENKTPIDIKTLIQTSNIDIYNKTKLVDKLKENFSEQDQKLYVCNLFLFLNYHPINDYVINLDNVWKFIGFSKKGNAKRLLENNFKENIDYKIVFLRTEKNKVLLLRTEKQKNEETRGRKQETIMLNINTFKKLCLKANTDNADKIHDYYIKLEMIYNELIKEELNLQNKLQKQIENETKSTTLIENYLNKSVVYIGTVREMDNGDRNENENNDNSKIVKYGITRCVKDTLDRHRKTYGHQFYFNYMTECGYKDVVERRIQTHNDLVSRHVREYNGKKCNELLRLDQNFTINNLITIIKTLQESMESRYDREIELAREKTQMEREKTKQKELDVKLEIKRMEFELRKLELEKSTITSKYASIYEEFIDTCTSYSGNADDKISMKTLYSSFCDWVKVKQLNIPLMHVSKFTKSITQINGVHYKNSLRIKKIKTTGIINRIIITF